MATRLKPRSKKCDVRGSTDAIGTFDDDKLTAVLFTFDSRKRSAIKMVVLNGTWTAFFSGVD